MEMGTQQHGNGLMLVGSQNHFSR